VPLFCFIIGSFEEGNMKITALKGTKDILPQDSHRWHHVEDVMRRVCALFGFREIRTPVIEHTELFLRGVGDTTDIVQKETYTFDDRGGRSVTLKPEGTAGVVRAYIENGLAQAQQPMKMYYLNCPVFRYERPQAGRLREHHQFGIELFGAQSAYADAEVIALALRVLKELGVSGLQTHINSIGCPVCRPHYHKALKEFFADRLNSLCATCRERYERNPLRILDCKVESCKRIAKGAPAMIDYLCGDCEAHFQTLQTALGALGIEYEIDSAIVRGLDYYTKTVFEVVSNHIGSQGTVCGGGRYDGLIETCGGKPTPGVGFGMGMERLLMVMQAQGVDHAQPPRTDVFVHAFDDVQRAFMLCAMLRERGIRAEYDPLGRSAKAQMRHAERIGARAVLFEGESERAQGLVSVREMSSGEQRTCTFEQAVAAFDEQLTKNQQGEAIHG
jgi:histidyl-tRNA synthetase